jgi:UPF0755 protein
MTTENKKDTKKSTKIVFIVLILLVIVAGFYGLKQYNIYFSPNISGKETYLYVKTGATLDDLYKEIKNKDLLKDMGSFSQAAAKMDLAQRLKPGRYKLSKGMNNRSLINMIKKKISQVTLQKTWRLIRLHL